jgi:hypothetical protein
VAPAGEGNGAALHRVPRQTCVTRDLLLPLAMQKLAAVHDTWLPKPRAGLAVTGVHRVPFHVAEVKPPMPPTPMQNEALTHEASLK